MDEHSVFPKTWMLVILGIVTLFVGVMFVLSLLGFQGRQKIQQQYSQPEVVLNLIEAVTTPGADYEIEISKYIQQALVDGEEVGLGPLRDSLAFSYIVSQDIEDVCGYEIVQSRNGYVEFATLTGDGEYNYPLIAFAYKLSADESIIVDYNLGRLQPFSRRHEEYREEWNT